jgi:hypothetical protein
METVVSTEQVDCSGNVSDLCFWDACFESWQWHRLFLTKGYHGFLTDLFEQIIYMAKILNYYFFFAGLHHHPKSEEYNGSIISFQQSDPTSYKPWTDVIEEFLKSNIYINNCLILFVWAWKVGK